ncbi:hypothetical protein RRG08_039827 [Elysia crispata]|uniref:Uncharacterized protein n=1 Tax=Elysia crispata TaxID=231223 RepID=A0AAE0XNU0_9GAST|nr:hypothetical protein RRG08_039827 [Elysia crispata]
MTDLNRQRSVTKPPWTFLPGEPEGVAKAARRKANQGAATGWEGGSAYQARVAHLLEMKEEWIANSLPFFLSTISFRLPLVGEKYSFSTFFFRDLKTP